MLYRDIFISHCLGFILCTDQSLVQILSETELTAGYLNLSIQCLIQEFGITKERFLQALSTVRGNQRVVSDNPEATYDTLINMVRI